MGRAGEVGTVRPTRQPRGTAPETCTVDGCDRKHVARGLCGQCYDKARRSGQLLTIYGVSGPSHCTTPGCEEPVYARGCCRPHYNDGRRSGEFTDPCLVPGCALGGIVLGMCSAHGGRARRYGLTPEELALLDTQTECDNPGCDNPPVHVDHDHATGKVRGYLCHGCNTSLGQLGDDPARIAGLITYLST